MMRQYYQLLCFLWALSLLGALALLLLGIMQETTQEWWFHAAGVYGLSSLIVSLRSGRKRP